MGRPIAKHCTIYAKNKLTLKGFAKLSFVFIYRLSLFFFRCEFLYLKTILIFVDLSFKWFSFFVLPVCIILQQFTLQQLPQLNYKLFCMNCP